MLNFAEQTGSGAVMLVWSFPIQMLFLGSIYNSPISCMYMYMYMYMYMHDIGELYIDPKNSICIGNDHTSMTAPLPVCSAKLSMLGLG